MKKLLLLAAGFLALSLLTSEVAAYERGGKHGQMHGGRGGRGGQMHGGRGGMRGGRGGQQGNWQEEQERRRRHEEWLREQQEQQMGGNGYGDGDQFGPQF